MRAQTLAWLSLFTVALLLGLVKSEVGHGGSSKEDECPIRLASVEVLSGLIRCPLCECHQVLLDGEDVLYKVTPETPMLSSEVLNNVTITGGGGVTLAFDASVGELHVEQGYWLKFASISLSTDLPPPSLENLLRPAAVELSKDAGVALEDVDILTEGRVVAEYIGFARSHLKRDTYQVVEFPAGNPLLQYLKVLRWSSETMQAEHVVVSTAKHPTVKEEDSKYILEVSHSKRLLGALDILENTDETDTVLIVSDIVLIPEDWSFAQWTLKKNITIMGYGAGMPFLDFSFLESIMVVKENAHIDIIGIDFLNLAKNKEGAGRGFTFDAVKLIFFMLQREEVINVHLKDCRMILTCQDYKEWERTFSVVSRGSNSSTSDHLSLDVEGLHIHGHTMSKEEEDTPGFIRLHEAWGYGVSYQNIVITCDDTRHTIVKTPPKDLKEDRIPSISGPASREERELEHNHVHIRRPIHGHVDDGTNTDETIIIFKVILALLIPTFVILGAAFLWKLQKVRVKVNDVYSHGDSKSVGMTGGVTSKGGGSRKGPMEEMPVTSSSDRVTGLSSGKFSSAWEVRKNHAAEFIPDILAVAENIDDKQLVLQELLGQGSSGTVHKGLWRELSVAVKTIVFRGNQRDSQERQQAAIREVAITSGLTHPNVICTYSYDIKRLTSAADNKPDEGTMGIWDDFSDWKLYIIQEFCDGGSLRKGLDSGFLMDRKKRGPELEKGLEIASGIARGVHHIHTKNIIHGDLKPSNVLLKRTDKSRSGFIAKIADFGLSLKMHGSQTHVSNVQGGTPFYMAPEVLELGNASKAADVYAFGVVLWEVYMSHFSSTGVPSPHALSHFPTFPWSCPVMYGALAVSCVHHDPCQRPSFQDILDVLSIMWQQMRHKMMVSPAQSRGSSLDEETGQVIGDIKAARVIYNESIVVMPSKKIRELDFNEVYWTNDRN